jgi:hypothetical protein
MAASFCSHKGMTGAGGIAGNPGPAGGAASSETNFGLGTLSFGIEVISVSPVRASRSPDGV